MCFCRYQANSAEQQVADLVAQLPLMDRIWDAGGTGFGVVVFGESVVKARLREGANNAALQRKSFEHPVPAGVRCFTGEQAVWFTANYEIATHYRRAIIQG